MARTAGRNIAATNRAASVPVSQPDVLRLASLRSKKQRPLVSDDRDAPSSGLPAPRRAKRNSSFRDTSYMLSASASTAMSVPNAGEQRPKKRQRRSSSTPASRPSQLSAQLQPRRRARSRAGSPASDVVPPPRFSSRLARKIHSFVNGNSSDIYTHLAGSHDAGSLLSEPPTSSVILPPLNGATGDPKPRGRRGKAVDLTDESVKRNLMEEWARMRRSQGTLSVSRIHDNPCFSQVPLRDTREGDEFPQLEQIARGRSPDARVIDGQGTMLEHSRSGSSPTRMTPENALPADTHEKKMDHLDLTSPSEAKTEQLNIAHNTNLATITGLRASECPPSGKIACLPGTTRNHIPSQYTTSPRTRSVLPSREHSPVGGFINEQSEPARLDDPSKECHAVGASRMLSLGDGSNVQLDSNEEFYMFDVPEILTLPWEPVTPRLYVPPSLRKLISGMKEQLMIEARARRRAESLYQAELSRRVFAEQTIKELWAELEKKGRG